MVLEYLRSKLFSVGFLRKELYSIGFLRCTSDSVDGPYFIHVISFVVDLRALRPHSIIYFYERGGLIERGLIREGVDPAQVNFTLTSLCATDLVTVKRDISYEIHL